MADPMAAQATTQVESEMMELNQCLKEQGAALGELEKSLAAVLTKKDDAPPPTSAAAKPCPVAAKVPLAERIADIQKYVGVQHRQILNILSRLEL